MFSLSKLETFLKMERQHPTSPPVVGRSKIFKYQTAAWRKGGEAACDQHGEGYSDFSWRKGTNRVLR